MTSIEEKIKEMKNKIEEVEKTETAPDWSRMPRMTNCSQIVIIRIKIVHSSLCTEKLTTKKKQH